MSIDVRKMFEPLFNTMDLYSVDFSSHVQDGIFWLDWVGVGIAKNDQCKLNIKGRALGYVDEDGKIYELHDHITGK